MTATSVASSRRRSALPVVPGPLVGRDEDLAALQQLLAAPGTRLVTLTGPPGVGKTRLAIAAAAAVGPGLAGGVVFVDLTAVRDPALVPGEVLGALGVPDADHAGAALAGAQALVVLDNFEHVLGAGTVVATVLAASPGLRVLVTSRERLHLHAEREVPIGPLQLPRTGDDPEPTAAAPAVAMLVREVRAFQPGFAVTAANAAALTEICERLDGLPLALELAAARLRLFTPGELTFRLRHRLKVLTSSALDLPERHRTLRAAVTWSHNLLAPPERLLFRRFSVFAGGATLEAVEHVCAVDDVEGTVESLVDKSLLQRRTRPVDVAEFVMLESLREYAAELLAAHGDDDATRRRHARYYAGRAARHEAGIGTLDEAATIADVGLDLGNMRTAMACATAADDVTSALQLAAAIGWYAYTRGRLADGRAALDAAIAAAGRCPGRVPDDALAGAVLQSGVVALGRGELDRADERLRWCGEINERVGDRRRAAIVAAFFGHLARGRGDFDTAVAHHERAAVLYEGLGNAQGVAWSRYDLGLLARRRGLLDEAARGTCAPP